jgi:solute carrier family 25 (mitochondrial carnitine/acylcarnitine transporter), member 20/29
MIVTNSLLEGALASLCGAVYGLTSPFVGHPLDTLKSLQQADPRFQSLSLHAAARKAVQDRGLASLYRGVTAPLLGSIMFRSLQFGSYAYAHTLLGEKRIGLSTVPGTQVEWRVLVAGVFAGVARAAVENPVELIKTRRQTGGVWHFSECYHGLSITTARNTLLLTNFFVLLDVSSRHVPHLLDGPLAPFFKGGVCATLAWWTVWPLEVVKSQIQAASKIGGGGDAHALNRGPLTIVARFRYILQTQGVGAFRTGLLAGTLRSILANGASMLAFSQCRLGVDSLRLRQQ